MRSGVGGTSASFPLARHHRMVGSPNNTLAKLQEAARPNLADFMTFEVGPDEDQPEIQNDGMQ